MWPNESEQYRQKRDALLEAEAELRRNIEAVAALRREMPLGGQPKEDYTFQDVKSGTNVSIRELFQDGKDTLILYNLMYKDGDRAPCTMCASMLDSLNGAAPHIEDQASLAIIALAKPEKIKALAESRGWDNLRFLSSSENTYNPDYGAETEDGAQWPMLHVWQKTADGIRHFWGSELFGYKGDPNWQSHARHVDMIWPLWNMLDLTPNGRGENWYPKLAY